MSRYNDMAHKPHVNECWISN